MSREIELKLAFPAAALSALLAHPRLAAADRLGPTQTLTNTYFDTPDLELSAQRIALRTRRAGDTWLQTVKCAAESVGGLSSRPEWECAYDGRFDFSTIDVEPVRATLEKHRDALVPLFTTDFERDTLQLEPRAGVCILLMIDRGSVAAAGRMETISELELELAEGSADDLLALAIELSATLPLLPYDPSKAARGYRLFHGESVSPQRATAIVPSGMPAKEAFRAAALPLLAAWAANQHGALGEDDPEFVHQLRVTLNKLGTLERAFRSVLPAGFASMHDTSLQPLRRACADLRDLQVMRAEILAAPAAEDSDAYLPPLLAQADLACAEALAATRAALTAPGAGTPMLRFYQGLLSLQARPTDPSAEILSRHALHRLLRRARRRLLQAGESADTPHLHALRIAIRQLRLGCELFSTIHGKPTRRNATRLADLQNRLGKLHDLAEAMPRLGTWIRNEPALTGPVAFVAGWHAATSLKLRRTILRRTSDALARKRWQWLKENDGDTRDA